MTELGDNQANIYNYLCERLNSAGLEIQELDSIGKLRVGQQNVAGMIAINKRLGYILEREGKLFTAGSVLVRLTLPEQHILEKKARQANKDPQDLLSALVSHFLSG